MLLNKEKSVIIIVDIQNSLNSAMRHPERVINNSRNLLKIAQVLDIPYILTEQVPEKLGQTVPEVRQECAQEHIVSKTCFSCCADSLFNEKLRKTGKTQVILTGIESHVCILQTALSLKEQGIDVFVVKDAISSRKELDYKIACARMENNGINMVSYEMVLFEWLRDSTHPEFRNISKNFIDRN